MDSGRETRSQRLAFSKGVIEGMLFPISGKARRRRLSREERRREKIGLRSTHDRDAKAHTVADVPVSFYLIEVVAEKAKDHGRLHGKSRMDLAREIRDDDPRAQPVKLFLFQCSPS